jgi:NAD(P)-dependent dehydrogenase (short-subunit alcohol dehydrogenase family)
LRKPLDDCRSIPQLAEVLIPATFDAERVEGFGEKSPMGRAAEPDEIAPSYTFFASNRLSSYYTGQNLVPAGGEIHPG